MVSADFYRGDIVTLSPLRLGSETVVGLKYAGLTVCCKDSLVLMIKILPYWFVLDGASRDDRSARDKTAVFFSMGYSGIGR